MIWEINLRDIRKLDVKNVGTVDLPMLALAEIVGHDRETNITQIKRPTGDNKKLVMVVLGYLPVDGIGYGSKDFPLPVLTNPSDGTPAHDEQWGTTTDSYYATKGKTGLLSILMSGSAYGRREDACLFDMEACRT